MNSYETARENDCILRATLRSKKIIIYIYLGAIVTGLIVFLVYRSVLVMLLCWALGSISNIFDPDSHIRKYLRKIGNGFSNATSKGSFLYIIASLVGVVIGTVLGFAIMGAFSPIIIIAYLIGILKVKKQIANNDAILSQFQTGNSQ